MESDPHDLVTLFREEDLEAPIKVFHELMAKKIGEILLVSTPYDAFIMEEDGSLTSKIINEYRGLNLSRPPRLTQAATGREALELLNWQHFDLVITMPRLEDMDTFDLVARIKSIKPDLPVILLAHSPADIETEHDACLQLDNIFIWSGDSDLLLALIKSVEDRLNAAPDTQKGMVRVLILVEDSPLYRSFLLPLIYKVVVKQTRSVVEDTLNEEHRLLKMRARPKILVAENYEAALDLFEEYKPYVFGVLSDTRFPKDCVMTEDAGVQLLNKIKAEVPYLPILLLSSEAKNRARAEALQAVFIDKNSPELHADLEAFFLEFLGFGDFVFRLSDQTEVGRASNLRTLEKILPDIPDEPIEYHARRNRFSNWLMARSEISLASKLSTYAASDFPSTADMRHFLISSIHALRRCRQKGIVVRFSAEEFDPDVADFCKIGRGSLGGKARGMAFLDGLLHRRRFELAKDFPDLRITVPKTLVISTDGFESFVSENHLHQFYHADISDYTDSEIRDHFLQADIPEWLYEQLSGFLKKVTGPLSIRSSSLLEDAQFQSYAGLYKTYMLPNNHEDFFVRLHHLITAVKLVYASTYYDRPREFAKRIARSFREDRMAVIIQQLAGREAGDYFYPAISGTAQSQNFYPVGPMATEDGIARIALGLGKVLDEGEAALRFSPRHPGFLPQFSTVEEILTNAQRFFYALKIRGYPEKLDLTRESNLERRDIDDAENEPPVRALASTYLPDEERIRDSGRISGPKILTFASILKHEIIPLPAALERLLEMGRKGMGGPVEIEFAVDLPPNSDEKATLYFLQVRPMTAGEAHRDVSISEAEIQGAICFSTHSLGHGRNDAMADIVYVKSEGFDPVKTVEIAKEIGKLNRQLAGDNRSYLLAGPGRWGSADRWLGIPVHWEDISGVGAMIEIRDGRLPADASQGSHFFQKITGRGIHYITLEQGSSDFFNWNLIGTLPTVKETEYLCHVRLSRPMVLKNDGRTSRCVVLEG
jgi:CheY-like chemotaxis protein